MSVVCSLSLPQPAPVPCLPAPGKKRPLPVFTEEDEEDENFDEFNFESDVLPPLTAPPPVPVLALSEDWVPGVMKAEDEEISRNRESLNHLFDDSHPASPQLLVVSALPEVPEDLSLLAAPAPMPSRKLPAVPPLRSVARPVSGPTTARRPVTVRGPQTARRGPRAAESTDDRILREAAEARRKLHERIQQGARMAAKFRAQNKGYQSSRLNRN